MLWGGSVRVTIEISKKELANYCTWRSYSRFGRRKMHYSSTDIGITTYTFSEFQSLATLSLLIPRKLLKLRAALQRAIAKYCGLVSRDQIVGTYSDFLSYVDRHLLQPILWQRLDFSFFYLDCGPPLDLLSSITYCAIVYKRLYSIKSYPNGIQPITTICTYHQLVAGKNE